MLTFNEVVNDTSFWCDQSQTHWQRDHSMTLQVALQLQFHIHWSRQTFLVKITISVQLHANIVTDTSGNPIQESTAVVPASLFVDDSNRPALLSFTLDLDEDLLILSFNETIDSSTVSVPELYLQSQRNTTISVSLTGSMVTSTQHQQYWFKLAAIMP